MLPLIDSLQSTDADAPAKFRTQFGKMLGHVFSNLGLGLMRGVGSTVSTATLGHRLQGRRQADRVPRAQLLRLSANFAFASDLALLLGGRLKFEELLMGRLADAMGASSSATRPSTTSRATAPPSPASRPSPVRPPPGAFYRPRLLASLLPPLPLPVSRPPPLPLSQLEVEAQEALKEAAANFPAPLGAFGGLLMTTGVAPLGSLMRPYSMPRDDLTKEVASLLTKPWRCATCSPRTSTRTTPPASAS